MQYSDVSVDEQVVIVVPPAPEASELPPTIAALPRRALFELDFDVLKCSIIIIIRQYIHRNHKNVLAWFFVCFVYS